MSYEPPNSNSGAQRNAAVLAFIGGALLLTGCKTTNGGTEVGHYEVSVSSTPIFRYGPAQSFGADFSLKQGQHVVMLKREFGYSRVMTDEGQTGYVATEDLKPAPPPSRPSTADPVHRLASAGGRRPGVSPANNRAVIEAGPLFGGDDLPPLPDRDPLQPGNAPPGFRINVPQRKPNEPPPDPKPPVEKDSRPVPKKGQPGFRINMPTPDGQAKKP